MKADTIEVLQEKLNLQSQVLKDAMNTAEIASKNSTRMAALKSAMETRKAIDLIRELIEVAHKQMEKIIEINVLQSHVSHSLLICPISRIIFEAYLNHSEI